MAAYDAQGWPRPKVTLVSGSGLAVDFELPSLGRIPLQGLVPWKVQGIEGHPMEAEVLLPDPERPVLYFRGRLHAYQGYTPAEAVFPVRLGALLGSQSLLLTNASGALDPTLSPGELVLVTDHLNLTGLDPLRGDPPAAWGPRFPDLSRAYDPHLRELAREEAAAMGLKLRDGVYAGLGGPSYETPAEVRMLQGLGAHLVGMSTVLEIIAGHHLGMRCAALAVVSNHAAGLVPKPLGHDEVLAMSRLAAVRLRELLTRLLRRRELAQPGGLQASSTSGS